MKSASPDSINPAAAAIAIAPAEQAVEIVRFGPRVFQSAAMREASWNTCGWPKWKVGLKSSSPAWRWIASTIRLRLWPALQHHSAAVASRISRPSGV